MTSMKIFKIFPYNNFMSEVGLKIFPTNTF